MDSQPTRTSSPFASSLSLPLNRSNRLKNSYTDEQMPLTEVELQQMSYRDLVELAKVNGVYQKKSAKKVNLIRRLSTVWTNDEISGIENIDPNRTNALTPLKEVDETVLPDDECEDQDRRRTFTKVKRATKRKTSSPTEVKSADRSLRRNTFTKGLPVDEERITTRMSNSEDKSETNSPNISHSETRKETRSAKNKTSPAEVKSIDPPTRQNTFTIEDEPMANHEPVTSNRNSGKTSMPTNESDESPVGPEQEEAVESAIGKLTRQNTFTCSPKGSPSPADDSLPAKPTPNTPSSTRKSQSEIPVLQLNVDKTPAPIDKLSVFERLSSKIALSERRSLVSNEKRISQKTSFFTPQSDKKSRLLALRDGRKNQMSPKSIAKKLVTSAIKTPAQPAIKHSANSTKKSSVKKPPNFAAIHKRNFDKMESLMENKNRLRERALFMSPTLGKKLGSSIPKLIRTDAGKPSDKESNIPVRRQMKMATKERLKVAVANKCSTGAALRENAKKVLKGVRINKRFQLQLALKQKTK